MAMCPFCLRVTRPATITAPGAINKNPVNATNNIPNFKPLGSALNSAQQPYFLATILWPISCSRNAGPTASSITGIERRSIAPHVPRPPDLSISKIPPTLIRPKASVKAAVASNR